MLGDVDNQSVQLIKWDMELLSIKRPKLLLIQLSVDGAHYATLHEELWLVAHIVWS